MTSPKCAFHDADELADITPETHPEAVQCFECFHVFKTPAEVLFEYNASQFVTRLGSAKDVGFCPLCLHDW
jgi:hypothetical protein